MSINNDIQRFGTAAPAGNGQGNKNTYNTGAFRLCMRRTVVCVDSSHRIN